MAQLGSSWMIAWNALTVSGKKKLCSSATARSNLGCTAAQEIRKWTSPSLSSAICPNVNEVSEIATSTTKARLTTHRLSALGIFLLLRPLPGFEVKPYCADTSNAFIIPISMQDCYKLG